MNGWMDEDILDILRTLRILYIRDMYQSIPVHLESQQPITTPSTYLGIPRST